MIVVDASAFLEVLLKTQDAPAIEARLFQSGETLHTPHLADVEIAQVLRKLAASRKMDTRSCRMALDNWLQFPVVRYPHGFLLPRVWELRQNISAYDATYIALAEVLDVPLVTHDERLAKAPGHAAVIELV